MSEQLEEIFAKCMERMEAGASLESCLASYPKEAAELEPLLRMTRQMKSLTNVGPRPEFARNARLHLENQLAASAKSVTVKRPAVRQQGSRLPLQKRFGWSAVQFIIAAFLALSATTVGVAYAANASNPGDPLYGLDLAMENVQLNLAPNVASKVQLHLQFASERLTEAQATFSKNDVTDGLEAVNEYGNEISAAAQLVGSDGNGADKAALSTLLENAQGVHKTVLNSLLTKVPEQARGSIQKALDNSNVPTPAGGSNSAPNGADENSNGNGKSNGGGNSNDSGNGNANSNDSGKSNNGADNSISNDVGKANGLANPNNPNNSGSPNGNGKGNGLGNPNNPGNSSGAPGVDLSACANSLSQQDAQTLADLAKQYGVDYQYVFENFCALGTIDKVKELLAGLQATPTDVPPGPPSGHPNKP